MGAYELELVESDADRTAYHHIRRTVLFETRERSDYLENGPEERKPENLSLLLKHRGDPIGTVRLDIRNDRTAVVRLVAIDSGAQFRGHGRELMRRVEVLARNTGIGELLVHAAPEAVGLYEKMGFARFVFADTDADSVQMRKTL